MYPDTVLTFDLAPLLLGEECLSLSNIRQASQNWWSDEDGEEQMESFTLAISREPDWKFQQEGAVTHMPLT